MYLKKQGFIALLFTIIHALFFVLLVRYSNNWFFLWALVLLPFYWFLPFDFEKISSKELGVNCLLFSFGFYFTQLLQLFLPAVISSALAGTLFCLLPDTNHFPSKKMQNIFYAGCFAGMSSFDWFPHYSLTILSCILGSLIVSVLKYSLIGFGGKLGTIGFASVIIWIFFQ